MVAVPGHDLTQSGVVTTPAETELCSIRLISGGSVNGRSLDIFRLGDIPLGMILRSENGTCESSWTTVAGLLVAQHFKRRRIRSATLKIRPPFQPP